MNLRIKKPRDYALISSFFYSLWRFPSQLGHFRNRPMNDLVLSFPAMTVIHNWCLTNLFYYFFFRMAWSSNFRPEVYPFIFGNSSVTIGIDSLEESFSIQLCEVWFPEQFKKILILFLPKFNCFIFIDSLWIIFIHHSENLKSLFFD